MRILVTGGAGFIGSHVVDAFVESGHDVLVVDDLSTGNERNLNPKARLERLDIVSPELARAFESFKPEAVDHHAAQVSVRVSVDDPVEDGRRNVLGTVNVLENARRNGTKHVIYASSGGAMYGEPANLPANEETPVLPISPYGLSKYVGELYGGYYRRAFGLVFTSLRYANIYGPRQDPAGEAGVIAIFTGHMLSRTRPIINGDGTQERDYVYVGDIVRANLAALEGRKDGAFNIATGVPTTVNEIFHTIAEISGYSGEEYHGPEKAGDPQSVYLDAWLAAKELGWNPQVPLQEGLARTVEFFKKQHA
ncbi:MAG: NAD-dependent epimerase/dehydratase family protein [Actinobacteria bacterium]|nr:MAG: NAD-dependent epimerase/dehydratase family protein [Actinomycetota bacterium]